MSDIVRASENLARLCMRGFDLSIDDYGTGYSNIQQLVRSACSELKIDQSFVKGFTYNESLRIVVESSVEMAHRLGLRIVAEGVETLEDWDALKQVGCDVAQGFFIARPMELAAFNEFASENRGGPRCLDREWTWISVFHHDGRSLLERRHEKKAA